MLNKKVLIWNNYELSARKGGPATYLWHLKEFVTRNNIQGITFLDDYRKANDNSNVGGSPVKNKKSIVSLVKRVLSKKLNANLHLLKTISVKGPDASELKVNLNDFDIIHFHSSLSLKQNIGLLKNCKAQILLTSHSPKIMHREIIEDWCKMDLNDVFPFVANRCEAVDRIAFERADLVVFPCEEAQEPYYNTWDKYAQVIANKQLLFLPTGITPASAKESREDVRKRLSIPASATVYCYAGRHNSVKGYDLLKEAAASVLKEREDIYFLIAGTVGPLEPISHERWIEVGWTNDPHSLINAADCFILPNRETYFDLILLEVLSLGQSVILSDTGGNRYFKKYKSPEIIYFIPNNASSLVREIIGFANQVNLNKTEEAGCNLNIFNSYFAQSVFGRNYIEMYNQIA